MLAGGAPPQGVDFLHARVRRFPVARRSAVLALTYLLLMRAFRSLLLPLKAVLLNLLSVAAATARSCSSSASGVGKDLLGLYQFPQIEGWIPIFLFAMLFGLSMDYEVFLVSRMREAWDETHDNARAVAIGLERTGRIITAAAVIMVAAFSRLHGRQHRRPAGVRLRARGRDLPRRDARPGDDGAVADGGDGPVQLVAAGGGGAPGSRPAFPARPARRRPASPR